MQYLKNILDYALVLEEQGHPKSSLMYIQRELVKNLPKEYEGIDQELLNLPLHLYSTESVLHLLTVTYYYKELLFNREKFFDKVYYEIVYVRGIGELEESLLILK
jgi:hypothetical protein